MFSILFRQFLNVLIKEINRRVRDNFKFCLNLTTIHNIVLTRRNIRILIIEVSKNKKTLFIKIIKIIKITNNRQRRRRRQLIKNKLLTYRKTINKTRSIRHRILKTIKILIVSIIKIKINKIISFHVSFNQILMQTIAINVFIN